MVAMGLNTNTYKITGSDVNASATLTSQDKFQSSWVIYNDSTDPVFVVSGKTAPTAVFPTSATDPVAGKVVGPGTTTTFTKDVTHGFISAIYLAGKTGNVYIAVGVGD